MPDFCLKEDRNWRGGREEGSGRPRKTTKAELLQATLGSGVGSNGMGHSWKWREGWLAETLHDGSWAEG